MWPWSDGYRTTVYLHNFSNLDIIDHWAMPYYTRALFDLTGFYLLSINFRFLLIYFISTHFWAKTRIWCHIMVGANFCIVCVFDIKYIFNIIKYWSGLGPNTHFEIKYNSAKSNTNCFSRFQFKYNYKFPIQIHGHFWFKYDSSTLPFLKFDLNMVQIRDPCFLVHVPGSSSVGRIFSLAWLTAVD